MVNTQLALAITLVLGVATAFVHSPNLAKRKWVLCSSLIPGIPGEPGVTNRKLSPLEQALLSDRATGSWVEDGWVDIETFDEAWLSSSKNHFNSFKLSSTFKKVDNFLAIDDPVLGRYRDDGWVDASEPIPPPNSVDAASRAALDAIKAPTPDSWPPQIRPKGDFRKDELRGS
jgi:hypothetical protein